VVSSNYFESEFCHREWQEFQRKERRFALPGEAIAVVCIDPASLAYNDVYRVLDNVTRPHVLPTGQRAKLLPSRDLLHVLVTTRSDLTDQPDIETLELDSLSVDEGVELFERYRLPANEQDLGQLKTAESLLNEAIELEASAHGTSYPKLAVRYSNKAWVVHDLGRPEEAKQLLMNAIALEERIYRPDHPELATRYNNLAVVEDTLGDHDVAMQHMFRAYQSRKRELGSDHPDTIQSEEWLQSVS
jgi:tetratricopeptide (TPR) repeat protein